MKSVENLGHSCEAEPLLGWCREGAWGAMCLRMGSVFSVLWGRGEAVAGFCCCCCQILKQTKKVFFGSVSELLGHHGSVCVVESKKARFSGDKKGQARYLLHRSFSGNGITHFQCASPS